MDTNKVALIGPCSVGKTSIVTYLSEGVFTCETEPTIGANFVARDIATRRGLVTLRIWDTAGHERYRSLGPMYSRGAAALVVVFDASNPATFAEARDWCTECRGNTERRQSIWIVANKSDLEIMPLDEASAFAAAEGADFRLVSAKTGEGIVDLFTAIAERIAVDCRRGNEVQAVSLVGAAPARGGCC